MPDRTTDLDVWIAGSERVNLDLAVARTRAPYVNLDLSVVTTLSPPGLNPQRLRVKLDMAVLNRPYMSNVRTTPVLSRYYERRPRWDRRIPITREVTSDLDVHVGLYYSKHTDLDILIQGTETRYTFIQVYIQLE